MPFGSAIIGGIVLAILGGRFPGFMRILGSKWVIGAIMGAYPAVVIGGMVFSDLNVVRRGMAWKSRRKWQVRVQDESLEVSCESRAPMVIQLADVRSARHVFDDNWYPPMNVQDAVVLQTSNGRIKIPCSATGFSELLIILDRKAKLERVPVEAFGWEV